jgi:YbbR domain-containing protein
MKTTKTIFATMAMSIVAMFLTANLYADVYLNVLPLETSKKVLVELTPPAKSTVTIYLYNEKGQLVYNEDIKEGSSYKKVFDFSNARNGIHTIVSDSKYLKETKEIKVEGTSIEVVSTKYLHRPVFTVKDDVLRIKYLNPTQSNVKLSIENSAKTYFNRDMPSEAVFIKSFDLKKLSPGNYTVSFEVDGYEFTHYITKDYKNHIVSDL